MRTVTYAFAGRGAALGALDRLLEVGLTRRELQLREQGGEHLLVADLSETQLAEFAANMLRSLGGTEVPTPQRSLREVVSARLDRPEPADDDWHAHAPARERLREERQERAFAFGEQRSLDLRERAADPELTREPGLRYADRDKPTR